MGKKVTISPAQFQEGLRRLQEMAGKGNIWVGDEAPTDDQYSMWVDTSEEDGQLLFKTSDGSWEPITTDGGIYVGSGELPEGYNIQIDPDGDASEISDGVTFFPTIDSSGNLSWTNNGGLKNPDPINLKGPEGKSAYQLAVDAGFKGDISEWLHSLIGTIVDISDISATVDGNSGIPEVEVQVTGTETEKSVKFIFKNLKGTKGDKGDKGDLGDLGITPNLQIGTVQSLGAGTRPTAEIVGTPEEPRLNIGIPTGARGYTPMRGIDYYTQADKEALLTELSELFLGGYKLDVSNTIPPEEEDDGKTITFVFPD